MLVNWSDCFLARPVSLAPQSAQLKNHRLYSLNTALPYGDKNEDDHVTVAGKVLGKVNVRDLADEEDIPVLEEVKAADVRAFKQKYGLL